MAATLKFVYLSDICVGINLIKRRIFVLKRNKTKSLPNLPTLSSGNYKPTLLLRLVLLSQRY